jgi:hypothetical protein
MTAGLLCSVLGLWACQPQVTSRPGLAGSTSGHKTDSPASGDMGVTTDGPTSTGDAAPVPVTVAQIQDRTAPGHPAPGTLVTLDRLVALTPKASVAGAAQGQGCRYGVWVADPEGAGPFSGILVVAAGGPPRADGGTPACPEASSPDSGGPIGESTQPGDVLTISGQYIELEDPGAGCQTTGGGPCTATYAQIVASPGGTVQIARSAGTGTVPEAWRLNATERAELQVVGISNGTTDRLRGALVSVDAVTVTCPALGSGNDAVEGTAGGCHAATGGGRDGGPFHQGSSDGLYLHAQSGFPALPAFTAGQTLRRVTGVVGYDAFTGHWLIVPRGPADLIP